MRQGRQFFGGLETAKIEISLLLCSKKFVKKVKAAKTAKFFGALREASFSGFFEIMQLRNNMRIQAQYKASGFVL